MSIWKLIQRTGPAIIVAAVVLGPGSITTSTKVGAAFGYSTLWVLVVVLWLLIGVASLAGHLGASLERSLCTELSQRLGAWAGWVIGIAFLLIVAGFQSSNNMAVIAGIEPLIGPEFKFPSAAVVAILAGVNGAIIAILYLARDLYKQVERIMKFFVMIMVAAFLFNFVIARPSASAAVAGLIPSMTEIKTSSQVLLVVGLIGTTFSVAGAFYQGYLVRARGWGPGDVRNASFDSMMGMFVLVAVTSVVLMTSAATFHGVVEPNELSDAGKMASQLKASFGDNASRIFCFGFLAGAFSSFLVNAMIGGHVFSDGVGFGDALDSSATRLVTSLVLLVGMLIATLTLTTGFDRTATIVMAQASTVVAGPAVMFGLLYLGFSQHRASENRPPWWMLVTCSVGTVVSLGLAALTTVVLLNKFGVIHVFS